jgi:hypothetical protein
MLLQASGTTRSLGQNERDFKVMELTIILALVVFLAFVMTQSIRKPQQVFVPVRAQRKQTRNIRYRR